MLDQSSEAHHACYNLISERLEGSLLLSSRSLLAAALKMVKLTSLPITLCDGSSRQVL